MTMCLRDWPHMMTDRACIALFPPRVRTHDHATPSSVPLKQCAVVVAKNSDGNGGA